MRFLVTNDDGIDAPGLAALTEVARGFGETVVVAPAVCHSAKSHAISMRGPICVEPRPPVAGAAAFACSGTPADCVRLGLMQLDQGHFDAVLSGVNPGGNAGVDVIYSGTVAAAREAAILGRIGVAVSQLVKAGEMPPWAVIAERTRAALERVLGGARPASLFNINLPNVGPDAAPPVRLCALSIDPWPMEFAPREPGASALVTEYRGAYAARRCRDGSDFRALVEGCITITPLQLDQTDHAALQRLAAQ